MAVLGAVAEAPRSLAELVGATGLARPTAHRLAVALEAHGLLRRDGEGRFTLGLRLIGLGHAAAEAIPVWAAARPTLAWLLGETGESVQLFVRDGAERVCVESLESTRELRTIVPVGARLPLTLKISEGLAFVLGCRRQHRAVALRLTGFRAFQRTCPVAAVGPGPAGATGLIRSLTTR